MFQIDFSMKHSILNIIKGDNKNWSTLNTIYSPSHKKLDAF